jgi:hypothetical protein
LLRHSETVEEEFLMTAAVKAILHEIKALSPDERLKLDQALSRSLEKEWAQETAKAEKIARRRKIDQGVIDRVIAKRRYGG